MVCQNCGNPRSECSDPKRSWFPQRTVDYAVMERAAAQRAWEALHPDDENGKPWHDGTFRNWAKDRSENFPYHRDDGVTIWVAPVDLSPDDDFLKPTREVAATDLLGGDSDDEGEVDDGYTP